MKRRILILTTATLLLAACGGSATDDTSTASTTTSATSTAKPAPKGGELLIVKSDCIGCHQKEDKLIGPAYQEIAAKYPPTADNINLLADKIIKGGKGVWGPIPMTPHAKITPDEAKEMVKYILAQKK